MYSKKERQAMAGKGIDPLKAERQEQAAKQAAINNECSEKIMSILNKGEESERVKNFRRLMREAEMAEIGELISAGTEKILTTKPSNPEWYDKVYNYEKQRWEYKRKKW